MKNNSSKGWLVLIIAVMFVGGVISVFPGWGSRDLSYSLQEIGERAIAVFAFIIGTLFITAVIYYFFRKKDWKRFHKSFTHS